MTEDEDVLDGHGKTSPIDYSEFVGMDDFNDLLSAVNHKIATFDASRGLQKPSVQLYHQEYLTKSLLRKYLETPAWLLAKRWPPLFAWWNEQDKEPPLTPEQMDPNRDFCYEKTGLKHRTMGRRILIKSPTASKKSLFSVVSGAHQDLQNRYARYAQVMDVGRSCYPPSEVYGVLPWVYPGDWVVFSNWEKAESTVADMYYILDLHIVAVIDPSTYPTELRGDE